MAGRFDIETTVVSGDTSPELVPVVERGALALAFPQPTVAGSGQELELGDLLADALFGEVIDISDLIPRVLSPSAEALAPQPTAAETVFSMPDAGDVLASHAAALTILYDDDILALDGTIL